MNVRRLFRLALGTAVIAVTVAGCSRSAQSHFERGTAYLEKGNVDAAVLEFRNAVEKDPKFAAARLKLVDLYLKQGNGAGALAEAVRAADLLPNDADAQLRAGSLLFTAGRAQDAKARADKALAISAKNANALTLRANAIAGLKDLDGAIDQMRQAIALEPSASRQANLGMLLHAKGKMQEAEAAFRQAVATDPKSIDAQVALARFLSITDRPDQAESVFKTALSIDPGNSIANAALASFYIDSNRAPEAEPYFKKLADTRDDPGATLALADYYVSVRRHADALAVLERLSGIPGAWSVARSRTAALLYADGKKADAYKVIDAVIAKQPADSEARVVRGRFLLAEGRTDEALAEAQQAVKSEPRNAEAHFLLGSIQKGRRDLAAAAASFNEVLRLTPRSTAAQLQLAGIELQRGEFAAATQLAEQAYKGEPRNQEAGLILARGLLALGELDRATAATRELVDRFPQSAPAHAQAGLLAMRKGDRAGARVAFEKALSLDPLLVQPLVALVTLDIREGKGEMARARVEARLQRTPRDSAVLVVAARTWASTGAGSKAEEFLRRAIDADASNFDAYGLLGQLYYSQGKLDQALAEYDKLTLRQAGTSAPATMAAMILETQGKAEEARRRYEAIVDKDPGAVVASNNLAYMYATRDEQLDRALQLAQTAKAGLPDNPAVSDTLAYVYIKKQLGSLAVPLLQQAIEKQPGEPAYHYHLGLAYAQVGNKTGARRALEQALRLKADFEGAGDARRLLATLG